MTLEEIDEELKATFGKKTSQSMADANIEYCVNILNSRITNGTFDANVEKPSIDAMASTLLAVVDHTNNYTFQELASKKPAIKRGLLYCIVKGHDNYDEMFELIKDTLRKHASDKVNLKTLNPFLNIIKAAAHIQSSKFMYCLNFPERSDDITIALHQLIDNKGDEKAALVIIAATEDGILKPTAKREAYVNEFNLNKSGFNKYMTRYQGQETRFTDKQRMIDNLKVSLRNTIKYKVEDGQIKFYHNIKKRDWIKFFVNLIKS